VPLNSGLTAKVDLTVTDADTAISHGSGDVPVLATPRVVALCEEVSLECLRGQLDPGTTTVGMRVQLDHLAPTKVGSTVVAEATLDRVEGRRLIFNVAVNDHCGLVAAGKVTRVVVERDRFLDKAR
jgi:fluoroacetyl-CoA thioesterase